MVTLLVATLGSPLASPGTFSGRFYAGAGDVEYLQLLDVARRIFDPDAEYQSLPMFYTPAWNGLVEGPTWGAWWIQNSYGPTYCLLPFLEEPCLTFLQNSQDLWFDQMGDGHHVGFRDWVAPDGALCDAAAPNWIVYKQGDGRVDIHDWGLEFTAAGLLMQAELLLISREATALEHYLPKLERCADFLESRRDPETDLFLAGPAGNLLAPSYAGWKKPDGTYGQAYLAGLSITTIAALDRLIELEKLAGRGDQAARYAERRRLARRGLPKLLGDDGCFVKSLDPDGTRHGVYGAAQYGYFEAVDNHDAVCFRVVDDAQSRRIVDRICSIPGLRPHDLIITNYPSLDDMYEPPNGLWSFGRWVNGGHWSTCEARMMMAYSRVGRFEDNRRSMQAYLRFAQRFRIDNPLVDFGGDVYQPKELINTVYDSLGIPAALVRGLFEYLYSAEGVTVVPHLPAGISALEQRFPIRLGDKRIHLATRGSGPVTGVTVNGREWPHLHADRVLLTYADLPAEANVVISLGDGRGPDLPPLAPVAAPPDAPLPEELDELRQRAEGLRGFLTALDRQGWSGEYVAAHARLAVAWAETAVQRYRLLAAGRLEPLPEPERASAAEQLYLDTGTRLMDGLANVLKRYAESAEPTERRLAEVWRPFNAPGGWTNIRSLGRSQSFRRQGEARRMTIAGSAEASCGWAKDLAEPLDLTAGCTLQVEVSGSSGARFFVDLMNPDGGVVFQTLWQDSPPAPTSTPFELPATGRVAQVIVYTMTTDGSPVHNDFRQVMLRRGETVLADLLGPR